MFLCYKLCLVRNIYSFTQPFTLQITETLQISCLGLSLINNQVFYITYLYIKDHYNQLAKF